MKFSHTIQTTASAEVIWQLWTDVEKWPEWDSELKSAALEGPFTLGAVGRLSPKRGASSRFVISQLTDSDQPKQRSYTLTVSLPLCRLRIKRFFACAEEGLYFTHEVSFEGFSAVLFRFLLGKQFRRVLPEVMQSLKVIAEAS